MIYASVLPAMYWVYHVPVLFYEQVKEGNQPINQNQNQILHYARSHLNLNDVLNKGSEEPEEDTLGQQIESLNHYNSLFIKSVSNLFNMIKLTTFRRFQRLQAGLQSFEVLRNSVSVLNGNSSFGWPKILSFNRKEQTYPIFETKCAN